jgi:hypothetical protein
MITETFPEVHPFSHPAPENVQLRHATIGRPIESFIGATTAAQQPAAIFFH